MRGDSLEAFLRACARVSLDDEDRVRVVEAAARVEQWTNLSTEAEQHGLTPLVWQHARETGIAAATPEWRQLLALVIRRRDQSREQLDALVEILGALDASRIDAVVLKGAALAHVLYPRPDLRPMGDLDILVAPGDAGRAQAALAELGFHTPPSHARPSQRWHHHLPVATRQGQGTAIHVEIHSDALSLDQPGRLRLDSRLLPLQVFVAAGRTCRTLGHVDMLTHLCAHALELRDETRLLAVADLVGYAARFAGEIDWDFLRHRRPRVVNALTLMHWLTPLPASLEAMRPAHLEGPPPGLGVGLAPLSEATNGGRGAVARLGDLLYPSEWWMRAYYGVPPDRSLGAVRWSRHLWRVVYWGGRRLLSNSIAPR